jgi:hypothetical protein
VRKGISVRRREDSHVETQEVSQEARFERFGEVKTYRELAMEQGNRLVPVSTLVVLGWRMLPSD